MDYFSGVCLECEFWMRIGTASLRQFKGAPGIWFGSEWEVITVYKRKQCCSDTMIYGVILHRYVHVMSIHFLLFSCFLNCTFKITEEFVLAAIAHNSRFSRENTVLQVFGC